MRSNPLKSVEIDAQLKRLFTRRRLTGRWDCSVETLKRLERRGVLTVIRIGGMVRYSLDDILEVEKRYRIVRGPKTDAAE
jgi:hypothetical protein